MANPPVAQRLHRQPGHNRPPREQPIVAADRHNQLNSPQLRRDLKALRLQSRLQPLSTLAIAGTHFLQMTPKMSLLDKIRQRLLPVVAELEAEMVRREGFEPPTY